MDFPWRNLGTLCIVRVRILRRNNMVTAIWNYFAVAAVTFLVALFDFSTNGVLPD